MDRGVASGAGTRTLAAFSQLGGESETGALFRYFEISRIAFRVPSANDLRNILGQSGAEKLQRPGDMIYTNGVNIVKGRCAYMEILEVKRVNDFIKNQTGYPEAFELPDPIEEENAITNDVDMQHLDPLFEDAARLIVREQCWSTSLIQRKYGIGYNRAGRLMDQLEKAGIVSQAQL